MKQKKSYFPKPVLKNLVNEIKRMIVSNAGRLSILDLIEDIPFEVRPQVIDGLSAFHEQELVPFYYLLKMEYGNELAVACDRAIEKYRMVGMDVTPPIFFDGEFVKAYASISRHTGRMTIDVAWRTGTRIHVECFYLTFNPDGIHSFFIIENMSLLQYEKDRTMLSEMVELSLEETCYLIQESFNFNVANMNRPAPGKFLYQKYLDQRVNQQEYEWVKNLLRRISARLTPRQVINSFFSALNRSDFAYIFSLLSERQLSPALFLKRFAELINHEAIILEGEAQEVHGTRNTARVTASMFRVENHQFYNYRYKFYLRYESGYWSIGDIEKCSCQLIVPDSVQSPLSRLVFCRVYQIVNIEGILEILERIDNISEIEELTCGTHIRISYLDDNFNHGVSFISGVIADVVLNGDELVIMSQSSTTINDIHYLLSDEQISSVIPRGDYEVSLMTVYTYLGGHYNCFEDLLYQSEDNSIYDDGMRLITTRYLVKDRERVVERIEELKTIKIKLDNEYTLYYQIVKENDSSNFMAEYLLGPNWVSVSAFGERDVNVARQELEEQMYGCLEFDGMEVNHEGFFDILTADIKREYPGLESELKEIYLDKWYYSRLNALSGMSPSEACQTEEGSRLLWAMFKNLKQNSKAPYMQYRKNIRLKEYIRKVEQKKREQTIE